MDAIPRDATEIAARVHAGELHPDEVLDGCTRRIESLNPGLNALVHYADARMRASLARLEGGLDSEKQPLAGVPFVVSESVGLAGSPHTSGSRYRAGEIAEDDATVVSRLVEAGAIPVGVANTAEIGFWVETSNPVYGRTPSPYDNRRISGGGLGGVAALVSTGCASIGVGVDMTGSTRIAAQACGVVSLKPTGGLIPLTGFEPFPAGRMRRFATMGIVARSARDLGCVLSVIEGPDGHDRAVVTYEREPAENYDLLWKHVLVCEDMNLTGVNVSPDVTEAVRNAAAILGERGAEVEDWRPRQFEEAFRIWLALVQEGYGLSYDFSSSITCGADEPWLNDLVRLPFKRRSHTGPVLAMGIIDKLTRTSFLQTQRLAAEGRRLQERLSVVLQNGGLLLLPAYPTKTPKHGRSLLKFRRIAYAAIINSLELPSVTVPIAMGSDGMPIAVQIVAERGREDACIAAAIALQESVRGIPRPSEKKIARWR